MLVFASLMVKKMYRTGGLPGEEYEELRRHERTGRPLGNAKFREMLEKRLGKIVTPQKGGRPKKQKY